MVLEDVDHHLHFVFPDGKEQRLSLDVPSGIEEETVDTVGFNVKPPQLRDPVWCVADYEDAAIRFTFSRPETREDIDGYGLISCEVNVRKASGRDRQGAG